MMRKPFLFFSITVLMTVLTSAGCALRKVRPVEVPIPVADKLADKTAEGALPDKPSPQTAKSVGEVTVPVAAGEEPVDIEVLAEEGAPKDAEDRTETVIKKERILVLPSVSFVDKRMSVYADKLSSWESLARRIGEVGLGDRLSSRWNDCLASIEGMFRRYSVLMEALLVQDHPAVKEEQFLVDPWLLFQGDIAFLEDGCDQVYVDSASLIKSWDNRLSETEVQKGETLVIRYADEGRYEEAINVYGKLMESQPDRAVGVDTSKMYGLALLRIGRLEMAAEVLAGALKNMRPSQEKRALRRLVADLLLASGKLAKARGHYRELADYFESRRGDDRWVADQLALLSQVDVNAKEFPLYLETLKLFISFDGRHIPKGMVELVERMEGEFRESPLSDQARQMLVQLEDSSREWVAGRLDQVDVLMANDNFDQAKGLLEQLLFDDLPAPVHGTVQRAMDNLLVAEMRYRREQQEILDQTLSAQWDNAVLLFDAKKYDEAIETFKGLFNTEYDVPARVNIQKAAEAASVEMRRRSATIFVKARKEGDENRKREFLRESWQLLYDITVKYPEVRLIDKVRQNLEIIEKHIELFDPVMLQELKTDQKFDIESRNEPVAIGLTS